MDNHIELWQKRILGEEITLPDVSMPISHKDFLILLNRYPFLELVELDTPHPETLPDPKLIRSDSGWLIHDYQFIIASSLGEFLYNDYAFASLEEDEEGEGGAQLNAGKGTIVKQAFDTVVDMVILASERGWKKILAASGTQNMRFATWVVAQELGMELAGYNPTLEDEKRQERISRTSRLKEMVSLRGGSSRPSKKQP